MTTHAARLSLRMVVPSDPPHPSEPATTTTDPTHPGGTVLDRADWRGGCLATPVHVHTRWASPRPAWLNPGQPTYGGEVTKLFESGPLGGFPTHSPDLLQNPPEAVQGFQMILARVAYPALFGGLLCLPGALGA